MPIEVIIHMNHVVILGQTINRPESISPSQWMDYWERVAKIKTTGEK